MTEPKQAPYGNAVPGTQKPDIASVCSTSHRLLTVLRIVMPVLLLLTVWLLVPFGMPHFTGQKNRREAEKKAESFCTEQYADAEKKIEELRRDFEEYQANHANDGDKEPDGVSEAFQDAAELFADFVSLGTYSQMNPAKYSSAEEFVEANTKGITVSSDREILYRGILAHHDRRQIVSDLSDYYYDGLQIGSAYTAGLICVILLILLMIAGISYVIARHFIKKRRLVQQYTAVEIFGDVIRLNGRNTFPIPQTAGAEARKPDILVLHLPAGNYTCRYIANNRQLADYINSRRGAAADQIL